MESRARTIRRRVVEMIGGSGKVGHLGGSSSAADIIAALYFYKMKVNAKNPGDKDRDRFILSKGHAALAQYAALAELGFFPECELARVKELGAMLQGHPDMTRTPGIEANTGSLGMGLSIGLGVALGLRLDANPRRVYVLLGDGELAEGQVWEAAMAAAHYKTDNLVAIVDNNGIQAMGALADRMDQGDFAAKFSAFGWHVIAIDGHSFPEICGALDAAGETEGRPTAIVAKTVKGKYFSFAENSAAFHNSALTAEQYEKALYEVENYEY